MVDRRTQRGVGTAAQRVSIVDHRGTAGACTSNPRTSCAGTTEWVADSPGRTTTGLAAYPIPEATDTDANPRRTLGRLLARASATRGEHVGVEKTLQSPTEDIIVVTGDHMAGPGHIDHGGRRDQLTQFLGTFLADHIRLRAPHEHRRNGDRGRSPRARSYRTIESA